TPTGAGFLGRSPTAVLVPPAEQLQFLRGIFTGNGATRTTINANSNLITGDSALFFDANVFRPGGDANAPITPGVTTTNLTLGPQVALVSANTAYPSPVYSAFTDFGPPPAGGLPGVPGGSGVQGLGGELLIGQGVANNASLAFPIGPQPTAVAALAATQATGATPSGIDQFSIISTPYRRFEDAAFDYYGYFSYRTTLTFTSA